MTSTGDHTTKLRVYLCGQRYFGQAVLDLLLGRDDLHVIGVSSPMLTPDGREDRLWGTAGIKGLPRMAAGHLRSHNLPPGTDLIICAHSHDYLSRAVRRKARLGAIGYHPSLLPLHRGRDAVAWAIRDRDRVTGGSVFWLNDTVDGGPIAASDWCFIRPNDDAAKLWRRDLMPMGLRLIAKTLGDIVRGRINREPQDVALVTWEPSINPPPLFRPELIELQSP